MKCIYCKSVDVLPHPTRVELVGCPKCMTAFYIVDGELREIGSRISLIEIVSDFTQYQLQVPHDRKPDNS